MPVDFHWDDDAHTIIRIDIHGDATWGEYHRAVDQIEQALQAASHRIDVIYHEISAMPKGNPLPNLKASFDRLAQYPNYGLGVVAVERGSPSGVAKTFIDLMMKIYHVDRSHVGGFYGNLEEARQVIAEARAATAG